MIDLISPDELLNMLLQAIEEESLKEVALHIREEYLIDTEYKIGFYARLKITTERGSIIVWFLRNSLRSQGQPTNIEQLKKNYPKVFK